jgi:apolipoprotein D and lipocalin family protein
VAVKALWFAISVMLSLVGCSSPAEQHAPLATVAWVDLARYAGTWHEIARYPNRFQQDCASDTTATYVPLDRRRIEVRNRCRRADGSETAVTGVAEVVDEQTNAKLRVSFLPAWLRWTGIGRGDYWVLYLTPDYRLAVVGEPSRRFLWILARTPTISEREYQALLPQIRAAGYATERLMGPASR